MQEAEIRTLRKILRLIEYAETMKAACLCRSLLDFSKDFAHCTKNLRLFEV